MKLRWTRRATRDLSDIRRYISSDNPEAARRWVERLQERARGAAELPYSGRMVPELRRPEIREVLLRSYRIVYRVREEAIDILTVFEGHRLLPDDLE